jgi:hypothetical protein
VRENGHLRRDAIRAVTAGYHDAHAIEICSTSCSTSGRLHVVLNIWTNYINEVAKTDIEFPWSSPVAASANSPRQEP